MGKNNRYPFTFRMDKKEYTFWKIYAYYANTTLTDFIKTASREYIKKHPIVTKDQSLKEQFERYIDNVQEQREPDDSRSNEFLKLIENASHA